MTVSGEVDGVEREGGRLIVEADLTLPHIPELHARLQHMLATQAEVTIDCTAAVQVDLSGIQLLLAARRSARQCEKRITLATPAAGALRAALDRGGFLSEAADPADRSFWLKDQHNQ